MNKIFLILSIVVISCSCNSQKSIPTVESINGKYYNILPNDKNIITVNVKLREFESSFSQISAKALSIGDTALARQILTLHTKVTYDRFKDTIIVDLSPIYVNENSPLFKGVEQIKSGFKTSVLGCFQQIKSSVFNEIISGYISKPTIETQSDNVIVNVIKKDNTELYTFSNDYKEIKLQANYPEQEISGVLKAQDINKFLVINYMELVTPQFKLYLNFKYGNTTEKITLQELNSKVEMPGMNYSVTFLFWNWEIK
jgi:hypothetical protein